MTMVPSHQNGKEKNNRSTTNYVFCNNSKSWNNTTPTTTTSAMNQVHEVEGGSYNYNNCLLGSEFLVRRTHHMMAEQQDSRTNYNTTSSTPQNEEQVVGSTSKGDQEEEEKVEASNNNNNNNNNSNNNNWLQLSIGFHHQSHHTTTSPTTKHDHHHHHQASSSSGSLVELELLPSGGGSSSSSRPSLLEPQTMLLPPMMTSSSFVGSSLLFEQTSMSNMASGGTLSSVPTLFGHHHQLQTQPQEMMNWTFGPLLPPHSMPSFNSSSCNLLSQSCSSLRPPNFPPPHPLGSNYFPTTPFPHFPPSCHGFDQQFDVGAGPSSDVTTVRVVDPPRRPHSGIWFMLQASQNQVREPFLPQIPKSYLRIKDGRMTVRLLLKYLVSKLRLENESEIEITCRGQQLLPFLTLQHVRDNIWTPRDTSRTLLSDSSTTTDHVMVLHYGRSAA